MSRERRRSERGMTAVETPPKHLYLVVRATPEYVTKHGVWIELSDLPDPTQQEHLSDE